MELYEQTAAKLSEMLQNKECSAVELCQSVQGRIAAVEDKVGAYVYSVKMHWHRQKPLTRQEPQAKPCTRWLGFQSALKTIFPQRGYGQRVHPRCWQTMFRRLMQP